MRTQIYIEALLVDEKLADQDWEAWNATQIDGVSAFLAWMFITNSNKAG